METGNWEMGTGELMLLTCQFWASNWVSMRLSYGCSHRDVGVGKLGVLGCLDSQGIPGAIRMNVNPYGVISGKRARKNNIKKS